MATVPTPFELWLDSPLVRRAIAKAGRDLDPLEVFEELVKLMNELEQILPGLSFEEILAVEPTPEARAQVAALLIANGLTDEELNGVLPRTPADAIGAIITDRRAAVLTYDDAGVPAKEIAHRLGMALGGVYRHLRAAGRGKYKRRPEAEAIGRYAVQRGVKATLDHFSLPDTQESTVRNWMQAERAKEKLAS